MDLIDQAKQNGVRVKAWTFDELYGRSGPFLDGLDARGEAYVGEIPPDAHVWFRQPTLLRKPPKIPGKKRGGRPLKYPLLDARDGQPEQVRHLAKNSPGLTEQNAQRYRIKDTQHGPEVWEIQWHTCWRKTRTEALVSCQNTLIVARNVLTGEVKYFLSNRVPGRAGWSLRAILRVAFGRWQVEACFREAKEEIGLDHFECRGWRCIHRHLYVAILSQLFCAKVRHQLSPSKQVESGQLLTLEQVRRAMNVFLETIGLPRRERQKKLEEERTRQRYHARRNAQAARSHRKRRRKQLAALGINPDQIKSVPPKPPS